MVVKTTKLKENFMVNIKNALNFDFYKGLEDAEFWAINRCFKAQILEFKKNQIIVESGDELVNLFLILKGEAEEKTFTNKNENLISTLKEGDIFGLEDGFNKQGFYLSNLIAKTNCTVISLNAKRVITPCVNNCLRHQKVQKNILSILSNKLILAKQKFLILSKRTIKDKLLEYLKLQYEKDKIKYFDIPLSRQELADYLLVDRSALSIELSRLKQKGVLDYNKNHFHLKKKI